MREALFKAGPGGLLFADIANDFATATVCLQGAHLTRWQPRSQAAPVIFMAAAAQFAPGKAIRGGIPLCWPWFGPNEADPSQPSHGFARTATWQAQGMLQLESGATRLRLCLTDDDASRVRWPHAFRLEYEITVGETLELSLVTTNTDPTAFIVGEALHTYFNVGDIESAQVVGLDGVTFEDKVNNGQRRTQAGAIGFGTEVDRLFVDTAAACTLIDSSMQRRIHIDKTGSRSTVVWNPGYDKASRMGDLGVAPAGSGSWRQMVCVESANAADNQVTVAPGQSHRLGVLYRVDALR
jgi:D-hexose-6-phosphate mutarotase